MDERSDTTKTDPAHPRTTGRSGRRYARSLAAGMSMLVVLPGCGPAALSANVAVAANGSAHARPNVVVILTDDQRFDTLFAMPRVQRQLADHGVTFDQAVVSNSLCCPSRAALLTGSFSHTNGVYTNVYTTWSPYGAWPAFHELGDEEGTIAVALDDQGYRTGLFGKYLNDFGGDQAPPGWDEFAAFVGNHQGGGYYDYSMFVDDDAGKRTERHGSTPQDYSTDVLADDAVRFIRTTPSDTPLFLYAAPYAPHAGIVPAPGDIGTWSGYQQQLPPNFDETDVSDKPPYISQRQQLPERPMRMKFELEYEALQGVDRLVGRVVAALRASDRLRDTFIVFMSDNGVAFGEHRWDYKLTPYEEAIHVPMVVRYDPLTDDRAGRRSEALVANVDVAPTIADVAGVAFDGVGKVDGVSIAPVLSGAANSVRTSVLLEHIDYPGHYHVPSYCGLRTPSWAYVRYSGGSEELYRLSTDPYELRNIASTATDQLRRLRAITRERCRPLPPEYRWA
jgi:N-acetylglucosamine-6-sulfatase